MSSSTSSLEIPMFGLTSSSAQRWEVTDDMIEALARARQQLHAIIIEHTRSFILSDTAASASSSSPDTSTSSSSSKRSLNDRTQALTWLIASLTSLSNRLSESSSSLRHRTARVLLDAMNLPPHRHAPEGSDSHRAPQSQVNYALVRQTLKHLCETRPDEVARVLQPRAAMYRRFFYAADMRARSKSHRRSISRSRIEKWFNHFHYNEVFEFGAKALEYYAFNNRTRYDD